MKKNWLFSVVAVTLIIAGVVSCDDIIEKDLTNQQIIILAPTDKDTSSIYTQTFIWEELKGALEYHLQIVKPSFTSIQQFVVDTTVAYNQFSYTLQPGVYQWRIQAKNGSSSTSYQTYTLTIDSTNDLTNQHVLLLTPTNNQYVNSLTQTFTWLDMPAATNYVFQVFTSSNAPIAASLQSITDNTISYTFSAQGTYKWKVFAQNSTSSTITSEFTVNIDTLKPNRPILISPINDTNNIVSPNPVPLKWNAVAGTYEYQVQVAEQDSLFATPTDTLTTSTTYNFYATINIIYYWRVRAIDSAGNQSPYSIIRSFRRN